MATTAKLVLPVVSFTQPTRGGAMTPETLPLARAFGMHAERVERAEDLPSAIDRALARRPALLDVLVTSEAVSSDGKSGLAWVPDLQPLAAWNEAEQKWRRG
jgi:acetolactate synthase I/II/III large subunit